MVGGSYSIGDAFPPEGDGELLGNTITIIIIIIIIIITIVIVIQ